MFKTLFTLSLFLSMFIMSNFVSAQTITCTSLQTDLKSGMTSASVILLQEYLKSAGYLTATPTGYFGSATLSAVKAFQINNNITATGLVGTLTRTAISQNSCKNTSTTSQTQTTQTAVTTTTNTNTSTTNTNTSVVSTVSITSPSVGQALAIGSSISIRWNKTPSSNFNITLEQPGGSGVGFIGTSLSNNGDNQYVWKVGNVFSSQTNADKVVDTGTYRIRIVSTNSSLTSEDIVSGWFTIVASQFTVNSILPTSAPADAATSIVLFGSGFTAYNNSIYFDTNYSGIRANNLYVSPDGTVLVFTIPKSVSSGTHSLYVNNNSNTYSKPLKFTVTQI